MEAFTVTKQTLKDHRACAEATLLIAPLLPVTIFSDWEANLPTAKELITLYTSDVYRCIGCDLTWFIDEVSGNGMEAKIHGIIDASSTAGLKTGRVYFPTPEGIAKAMTLLFPLPTQTQPRETP